MSHILENAWTQTYIFMSVHISITLKQHIIAVKFNSAAALTYVHTYVIIQISQTLSRVPSSQLLYPFQKDFIHMHCVRLCRENIYP